MKWGYINKGALKHSMVFNDKSFVGVSPLYRAEVFGGELPPEEQPLKKISDYVSRDEERGKSLWNYMYKADKRGKGLKFENIQKYIKKVATGI